MIILPPHETGLARAVEVLRRGEVVACPTETVYGLSVNPLSDIALDALFSIKQRDRGKPVLLMVSDIEQIALFTKAVSAQARRCMETFWPGPLSLLLPAADNLPAALTGGSVKICMRCTSNLVAQALCRAWGGPLTSTSANISGQPPAKTAKEAAFSGIGLVLDGGTLTENPPSTVYDPDERIIVRPGPITWDMICSASC